MDQTAVLVFWKVVIKTRDEIQFIVRVIIIKISFYNIDQHPYAYLYAIFRIPYICVNYMISNKRFTVDLSSELMLITSSVAFVILQSEKIIDNNISRFRNEC